MPQRRVLKPLLVLFACLTVAQIGVLKGMAQDLPPSAESELRRYGLTEEEARRRAAELGIDLSDPVQAAQRARELGVSETVIRQLLRAVQEPDVVAAPDTSVISLGTDTLAVDTVDVRRQLDEAIRARAAAEARVETTLEDVALEEGLPYFGYALFRDIPDAFQPAVVGPVDDGYVVGPGDELRLSVWGAAEFQYEISVDREGRVFIPRVGQLTVAGRRLRELRQEMRNSLSRSYSGLTTDPPTVFMDLTLTRLRPIQVYVLGELARPGGYTVSSYSTAFNVLYSVGGPLTSGSLRNVQVVRGGEVISTVDMYNYLLRGYESDPVHLQSNDFLFIPPREKTVSIQGEVLREGIYELTGAEGMEKLLTFSGGLRATAYTKRVHVERIIPFDLRKDASLAREVLDFSLDAVLRGESDVELQDGDQVTIFSVVDLIENAATVSGEVYQPGRYEITDRMRTIRDLIEEADGLTGRAYEFKADLIRVRDDFSEEQLSLDLSRVMRNDPLHNLPLMARDSVSIYSVRDLEGPRFVTISGKVRNPGRYAYRDSMTVFDLLFLGGGLWDEQFLDSVFVERADLFRLLPGERAERIVPFNLGETVHGGGAARMLLRNEDEIRVYPIDVEVLQERFVFINGAVKKPGRFRYRDGMTLEDLLLQAGGLTEAAYREAVDVSRSIPAPDGKRVRVITESVSLGEWGDDRTVTLMDFGVGGPASSYRLLHRDNVFVRPDPGFQPVETVSITGEVLFPGAYALADDNESLSSVIERAGGVLPTGYAGGGRIFRNGQQLITEIDKVVEGDRKADVVLLPGDQIVIPRVPNTVAVVGNVINEGLIKYEEGKRLSYYLARAGGIADETEAIVLSQASGATFRVRRGLIPGNPVVDDGATIRVTRKPPKDPEDRVDVGNVIKDSLAIVASAVTVIAITIKALD